MEFNELYDKYYPRVHKYACYRTAAPQEADELTALIFEKLFKKYPSFDPKKANIEVWIFALARNVVNDYYRNRKAGAFASITDYEESLATADNTAAAAETGEERAAIAQAMAKLDKRERDLFGLKYAQGFNNRQIAAATGLSESNIGIILMRARNKLKTALAVLRRVVLRAKRRSGRGARRAAGLLCGGAQIHGQKYQKRRFNRYFGNF